ncbi:MAG: hypothetical protein JWM82_187 [Myxococcales bacterium]|nr:hypothetical protein [Myxococcales bacterium]
MADLSGPAITARLRLMAALLAREGFRTKGPAMDAAAITSRLVTLGTLSDGCRRLVALGRRSLR